MRNQKSNAVMFYGTSAELIKLWPLIIELEKKTSVQLLTTNQQPTELRELENRFELTGIQHLRSPDKPNLVSKVEVIPWIVSMMVKSTLKLRSIRKAAAKEDRKALVFVHGDTMTCLVGAICGRLARCKVVHVEAGLRSHDWRNPFPEEIDRVLTARLAQFHFAPDEIAVDNLSDVRGVVVNTFGNTSRDSMRMMYESLELNSAGIPYTLVSLHRAELLSNEEVFRQSINELIQMSVQNRIVMVLDSLTRATLERIDLLPQLLESSIEIHEKMAYPDFLKYVVAADRVVTDSGGLQEECGFLSIRCLIHRKATERFDGIGTTAQLSLWEKNAISDFISMQLAFDDTPEKRKLVGVASPSDIIVKALEQTGFI
jgi:UDP-N-acetylglucosamine 2-epimerase (non-hydrolysing)